MTRDDRVALILAFHADIQTRYVACEVRIAALRKEAQAGRSYSGGIWDDEDERKAQEQQTRLQCAYDHALDEKARINAEWLLVKKVFGENDCALAMTEHQKAIGEIPFVV